MAKTLEEARKKAEAKGKKNFFFKGKVYKVVKGDEAKAKSEAEAKSKDSHKQPLTKEQADKELRTKHDPEYSKHKEAYTKKDVSGRIKEVVSKRSIPKKEDPSAPEPKGGYPTTGELRGYGTGHTKQGGGVYGTDDQGVYTPKFKTQGQTHTTGKGEMVRGGTRTSADDPIKRESGTSKQRERRLKRLKRKQKRQQRRNS